MKRRLVLLLYSSTLLPVYPFVFSFFPLLLTCCIDGITLRLLPDGVAFPDPEALKRQPGYPFPKKIGKQKIHFASSNVFFSFLIDVNLYTTIGVNMTQDWLV